MSNYNILIAEDENIIALDIKDILEKSGYSVVPFVSDGETLLNTVQEEPPSLIIMDIYLKGKISGIDAAKKVWENYNIPIIFISGLDTSYLKNDFDLTKCGFIKKPFREPELLKAIHKLLKIY